MSARRNGWTFDVRSLVKGPLDDTYVDKRRLAGATVRVSAGIGRELELSFTTHWLRGETSTDVQARVLRLAACRLADLVEQLFEEADYYEKLSALGPRDPFWANTAAGNDNGALDTKLPIEVWSAIDQGHKPLRAIREWRGLTVDQLATLAGVSVSMLERHEFGQRKIAATALSKLSAALRVPVHLLLPDE